MKRPNIQAQPGKEEEFKKTVKSLLRFVEVFGSIQNMANMMLENRMERHLGIRGKKRIRRKKLIREIQYYVLDEITPLAQLRQSE